MYGLDTTAVIETPERVRFRFRVAGPARRAVAWLIDVWIQGFVLALFAAIAYAAAYRFSLTGVGTGALLVFVFVIQWFYGTFFEARFAGQTPGKKVVGLRVVRDDGSPIVARDAVLRNLLRAADVLPFGYALGVAVACSDDRMRRLGDLVAGTMVISELAAPPLRGIPIEPPISASEAASLPARVSLSRDERALLQEFVRRKASFSEERVEELAALFGPALSARTGIRAERWERVLTLAYARATEDSA